MSALAFDVPPALEASEPPEVRGTGRDDVSLMVARCVGACSRAPVVLSDGEVKGEMTGEQMLEQLERWIVE